jgi:hypothetical protein
MRTGRQSGLTGKNLDRLAEFLNRELDHPTLAVQIPSGAHIFHGSYDDTELTQSNLKLATNILLGMTLGYVEEAPLMMVFEYKPGQATVIDLSGEGFKREAKGVLETLYEQSQRKMAAKINELMVS